MRCPEDRKHRLSGCSVGFCRGYEAQATIAALPSWSLALTLLTEALLLQRTVPGLERLTSVVNSAAALSSGLRTASGQWFNHPIRWKTSLGLFLAAEKLNIELDIASHNIRLGSQTKAADWQAALLSFSDMSRCFLTPDSISSSTIFQNLPWAAAFRILSERLSAGLRPSESVLKALADAIEPQRLWEVALELLDGRWHQAKREGGGVAPLGYAVVRCFRIF